MGRCDSTYGVTPLLPPHLSFFSLAQQPNAGQGRLMLEIPRSHTITHTPVGRTPLDGGSASRRDLYLTTHNTHKRQTSMPPAGFEPGIPELVADARFRPLDHWDRLLSSFNCCQLIAS